MGYRDVMSTSAPPAEPRNEDSILRVRVRDDGWGGADLAEG
jgi:hypothetical protein